MSVETLREGLEYGVIYTGNDMYRIGAVIDPSKTVHSGNMHLLPMVYDTREDAQKDLDMLLLQVRGDES
jgi:hypothetical protein